MLLHRHMVVALVEEQVLEYVVRFGQRLLDIAELERLVAMDVARVAIVVNARLGLRQRFLRRRDGRHALYFTSISASASAAVCSSFAITAATGSPT